MESIGILIADDTLVRSLSTVVGTHANLHVCHDENQFLTLVQRRTIGFALCDLLEEIAA